MRVIFAIEFEFRKRIYSGIVRVVEAPGYREYHVRVMNSRVDNWLHGHHVFREADGALVAEDARTDGRTAALRSIVQLALINWLKERAPAVPPGSKREPGTTDVYIHSLLPQKK